jgi:MFS family permease
MAPAYRVVTIALVVLTTMIAFESMAITTAMPRAAAELGAVGSYGLAFSSMMTAMLLGNVLAGIWADHSGPLASLYAGQLAFAAGAVACAVAPSWGALLAGRVVTGVGAGLVVVSEFVAVGRVYPGIVRPRVFTWLSGAWVLPSVVGAPISGWLTTTWSWRWVFWVVVAPAVVAAVLVTARRTAFSGGPATGGPTTVSSAREHADHVRRARLGALLAVGAGMLQYAIQERGSLASAATGAGAVGFAVLAATAPRLLPGTFRAARGLPSVMLSRALFNGSFMATVTYLPLMLVQQRHLDLTAAGAVVAVTALGWSLGSWVQGRMPGGAPERVRLVVSGAVLLTVGTVVLTWLTWTQSSVWMILPAVVGSGLGMGLGSTTLSVLVLDLAPVAEHGRASASLQLADVLGSVLGIASATAVFAALHEQDGVGVYVTIFAGLSGVAALAMLSGTRCGQPARA